MANQSFLLTILVRYTNRTRELSSACDEAYNKFNNYNASIMNAGEFSHDNIEIFDIWSRTDKYIQDCNIFLSKIEDVPGDASERNRLKGEVTFLRAYAYFKLIRDYGGVPLITKPFDLNSDFTATLCSFADCVNFVCNELDAATKLLPVNYNTGDANFGRATKAAAMAIKSRVLLYDASPLWNPTNDMGKWQKASYAAKAIIDFNIFQLYQGNYADIFTTMNPELIMVRGINKKNMWSAFEGVEMFLSPSGFHGKASFAPSQNLVDAFGTADGKKITDPTSGYNPQHPYHNRDPRFYADIVYDGRPYGRPGFCQDRYAAGHTNVAKFYEGGLDSPQGWDTWNCSMTRYTLVQTRVFHQQNYLLPIPRKEILLMNLKQNPGYN